MLLVARRITMTNNDEMAQANAKLIPLGYQLFLSEQGADSRSGNDRWSRGGVPEGLVDLGSSKTHWRDFSDHCMRFSAWQWNLACIDSTKPIPEYRSEEWKTLWKDLAIKTGISTPLDESIRDGIRKSINSYGVSYRIELDHAEDNHTIHTDGVEPMTVELANTFFKELFEQKAQDKADNEAKLKSEVDAVKDWPDHYKATHHPNATSGKPYRVSHDILHQDSYCSSLIGALEKCKSKCDFILENAEAQRLKLNSSMFFKAVEIRKIIDEDQCWNGKHGVYIEGVKRSKSYQERSASDKDIMYFDDSGYAKLVWDHLKEVPSIGLAKRMITYINNEVKPMHELLKYHKRKDGIHCIVKSPQHKRVAWLVMMSYRQKDWLKAVIEGKHGLHSQPDWIIYEQ